MEKTGLYRLLYYFILNSHFMICADAVFIEVPKDMSVGEGEDVEMPCAFKALSSAPMSLEIQWWYIKLYSPKEAPHDLQIGSPMNRTKTVRVQGNAISHHLSLSKVKKEDEGVYQCRVSDLWAEETQDLTVHASLTVTARGGMVAEEAVSHIQNRWLLRNTNIALGGSTTFKSSQGLTGGARTGHEKHWVPQLGQPDLLPSMSSSTTTSVAKSSASRLAGSAAILWHKADHAHVLLFGPCHACLASLFLFCSCLISCRIMSTMDPLLFITLLFLHKLLFILLAY
ncbi:V-set and transmembrane domain-containing protein 2B isoform X2 [Girardinichthys multiradiatus]|uniref:V-set and transmembrane domain-containing protein 2B isoform X2 n=1 Tax=Girardinichthys multiradiatus TaxID=208333 RepID=UPI001FADC267|nr:V-set and transmembrane domain-containing protein 2B isoform X2 [Girardinichthys multiradiatus]